MSPIRRINDIKTSFRPPLHARLGYIGAAAALAAATVGVTASAISYRLAAIPKKAPIVRLPSPATKTAVDKELDALNVNVPDVAMSASPIPDLTLSALNILLPALPGKNILKNFAANSDFSFTGGIEITMPDIDVTKYMPSIPTGPATTPPVTVPPTTDVTPPATTSTSSAPTQSETNAANCAPFSSMPSASYCSMAGDANGIALCEKCKAAGL